MRNDDTGDHQAAMTRGAARFGANLPAQLLDAAYENELDLSFVTVVELIIAVSLCTIVCTCVVISICSDSKKKPLATYD